MKKVAILTGEGGQGHISIAHALEHQLDSAGCKTQIIGVLPKVSDKIYKILNKSPKTYGSLYRIAGKSPLSDVVVEVAKLNLRINLFFKDFSLNNFDIVISTHPFIHPKTRAKKIMIVPDPTVHRTYCAEPFFDKYLTFWNTAYEQLIDCGIKDRDIVSTGSLARSAFYQKNIKPFCDRKKNILIVAGGEWIEKSEEYLEIINNKFQSSSFSFTIICGKDKKYLEKSKRRYRNSGFLNFLGWQNEEEMANIMRNSYACLAFTIGNAVSCELGLSKTPVFIAGYIPGQEDLYRRILEEKKVAKYLPGNNEDKVNLLKTFLEEANPIKQENLNKWHKELYEVPKKIVKAILDK